MFCSANDDGKEDNDTPIERQKTFAKNVGNEQENNNCNGLLQEEGQCLKNTRNGFAKANGIKLNGYKTEENGFKKLSNGIVYGNGQINGFTKSNGFKALNNEYCELKDSS